MLFSFPEQIQLGKVINLEPGEWIWKHFPDGESYVRVVSDVRKKSVTILCSLNHADNKAMALIFLAKTLKNLGANKITLVAPYLGYMRQDKRFHSGEALTSEIFAKLLSPYIDLLVTVDPHLHRHRILEEIYFCKCKTVSITSLMVDWIKHNVSNALIIGPDIESEQWVKNVGHGIKKSYILAGKTRCSDKEVEITLPYISKRDGYIPVIIDDIISTAGTMIKLTKLLRAQGFNEVVCIGVHGLFVNNAYHDLQAAGATQIITSDTIPHFSNMLRIGEILKSELN